MIEPERWTVTGENQEGVRMDATYHGPDGYRVVCGITLPYTTDPQPGETSVQFSVRVEPRDPVDQSYWFDLREDMK